MAFDQSKYEDQKYKENIYERNLPARIMQPVNTIHTKHERVHSVYRICQDKDKYYEI